MRTRKGRRSEEREEGSDPPPGLDYLQQRLGLAGSSPSLSFSSTRHPSSLASFHHHLIRYLARENSQKGIDPVVCAIPFLTLLAAGGKGRIRAGGEGLGVADEDGTAEYDPCPWACSFQE
jgi:hypothetical protein